MNNIQSVERAAKLLGLFSVNNPRLGISEIGRELGLAKGTVQGIVRTLMQEGFLLQDQETKKYQLGYKIYELGVIFGRSLDINQKTMLRADEIAKSEGLIVRVGIWDRDSVLITLTAHVNVGTVPVRVPAYCTSLGKALLAFLDKKDLADYLEQTELNPYTPSTITDKKKLIEELELTAQRGYSINSEEHWLHRAGIGAPIFGRNGNLVASIGIIGEPSRILGADKDRLIILITETAREISGLMGYSYDRY